MILPACVCACISIAMGAQAPPIKDVNTGEEQKVSAPVQGSSTFTLERFNKRLEDIDAAVAKVVDVRANFEQRRQTPLLKKPMVSKGEMIARGDNVRWDTKEPRRSTMLVVPSRIVSGQGGEPQIRLYYPEDKLVEVYEPGEKAREFMGAILPRLATLRSQFDLSPLTPKDVGGADDNPHLLAVLLEPREEHLRQHVQSVRVLIDDSIPAATRVVITNAQGDKTEIVFADVQVNAGVGKEEMDLHAPSDVRVSYPMRSEPAKPIEPKKSDAPADSSSPPVDRPKTSP